MARFDMSGLDDTILEMRRLGEKSGDAEKAMLQAGAEKVKSAWRTATEKHGLVDTGDMLESIGFKREPKKSGNEMYIDIYPQGKDRKGVRNAEKAFVLNYGTSTRKGTHFVDDADAECDRTVVPAMKEVWDEYLRTGRVPHVPLTPNHPSGKNNKA